MGSQYGKRSKRDAWRVGVPRPQPVGGSSALVCFSASVREVGAGVGIEWRSILHWTWRTTDEHEDARAAAQRSR
jgi:hypothetical protein